MAWTNMAWTNMEVQSVEIVQDMSYNVLLDRMRKKYKESGMSGVYAETLNYFEIAIQSIEKGRRDSDSVLVQCEESLNILIGAMYACLETGFGTLGYSFLKGSILEKIEIVYPNNSLQIALSKIARECEMIVEEEIENLNYWGDSESVKKAEEINWYSGAQARKSVFKIFADRVTELSDIVDRNIMKYYGRSDRKKIDDVIAICIAYHAKATNDLKYSFSGSVKKNIISIADNVWLQGKHSIVQNPFVSVLPAIENQM